jgi:hypothetical protein
MSLNTRFCKEMQADGIHLTSKCVLLKSFNNLYQEIDQALYPSILVNWGVLQLVNRKFESCQPGNKNSEFLADVI